MGAQSRRDLTQSAPEAPPRRQREVRGAQDVIGLGFRFSAEGWLAQPARVNGDPGIVIRHAERVFSVIGFTVRQGRIAAIDILADPARLRNLDLSALDD